MTGDAEIKRLEAERSATQARLRCILQGASGPSAGVVADALAEALHARISLYAATIWPGVRGSGVPANDPDPLSRRILTLNDGAVPSVDRLAQFLTNVAKKTGGIGHDGRR